MKKDAKNKILDISIIIVTYNSNWMELKETIDSVISQEEITYEIIIADDGSENNHKDRIKKYFFDKHVTNYKLVLNKKNNGTVYNLFSGLQVAQGEYIKDISPGDLLVGKNLLHNWIEFLKTNNFEWSFSEAVYYRKKGDKKIFINSEAHPNDLTPYINRNFKKCRWNYLLLDDIAMGATMLCRTKTEYEYCQKILNKVKYAEDNMWRIMMFDGIKAGYYPHITVLYEFGDGVSTSGNIEWKRRLDNDWKVTDEIIINTSVRRLDEFQKKILKVYSLKNSRILKYLIHGKIKSILSRKFKCRKTSTFLPEEKLVCK